MKILWMRLDLAEERIHELEDINRNFLNEALKEKLFFFLNEESICELWENIRD